MIDEEENGIAAAKQIWEEFWAADSNSRRRLDDEDKLENLCERADEISCSPSRRQGTDPSKIEESDHSQNAVDFNHALQTDSLVEQDDESPTDDHGRQHDNFLHGLRHRARQEFERLQGALAS